MSRCDSAAIVSKTSELFPEPETPVNTVSRRLGSSRLMSLRLFSRAPSTRIRSWLSAACADTARSRLVVAVLIATPSRASPPARRLLPPGSDKPLAVAHQFPAPQLVLLPPCLDAARGGEEPAVPR